MDKCPKCQAKYGKKHEDEAMTYKCGTLRLGTGRLSRGRDCFKSEITRLTAENERLRARTHEIQEREDKKRGKVERELHEYQQSRKWAREALSEWTEQRGAVHCSVQDAEIVVELRNALAAATERCERLEKSLREAVEWAENHDEWWMEYPERGGLDTDAINDVLGGDSATLRRAAEKEDSK